MFLAPFGASLLFGGNHCIDFLRLVKLIELVLFGPTHCRFNQAFRIIVVIGAEDGGSSLLYDAVVLRSSTDGVADLVKDAAARDFVAAAFAHRKCIGYVSEAIPLMDKAGNTDSLDEGAVELPGGSGIVSFEELGKLCVWTRELL